MAPKLLDLFCGAGGCSVGYARAGFDVVGVDRRPQPRYPFAFVLGDALSYLAAHGREYDAIHASPPCQAHTALKSRWRSRRHPELVERTRDMLAGYAAPWVIENVRMAPLRDAVMLCGSMFGLGVKRHRFFECNEPLFDALGAPYCLGCRSRRMVGVYGHTGGSERRNPHLRRHSLAEWREAMGIDWMSCDELAQAIPPAYTELIGRRLMELLS